MWSPFHQLVLLQLELPSCSEKSIWKLFYLACKKGETEAARYLLLSYPSLKDYVTSQRGNSGLCIACHNGHLHTAKFLVEAGFSLSTKNYYGCSLFYTACKGGHLEVAKWLAYECDADINARSTKGESPIGEACFRGHLHIVEWLIEETRVRTRIPDHPHLLTIASCAGHLHIVQYLLMVARMSYADAVTKEGQSPLMGAAFYNRLPVLKFYLQQGIVSVNETTPYGRTPLWMACSKGNLEMVEWLVEKGMADIEKTDRKGISPLFIACEKNHVEVVKYLLTHGKANPNATLESRGNPLLLACRTGNLPLVKVLVEAGADLNGDYDSGPMHVACINGRLEVVKYLVSMKVNVYARDAYDRTPLCYAVRDEHLILIRYLIDKCNVTKRPLSDHSLHFSVLASLRYGDASVIMVVTSRVFVSERILDLYDIPYDIRNFVRLGRTQYCIRNIVYTYLGPLVSDDVADIVLAYMD